jgi:hypothetical protein
LIEILQEGGQAVLAQLIDIAERYEDIGTIMKILVETLHP